MRDEAAVPGVDVAQAILVRTRSPDHGVDDLGDPVAAQRACRMKRRCSAPPFVLFDPRASMQDTVDEDDGIRDRGLRRIASFSPGGTSIAISASIADCTSSTPRSSRTSGPRIDREPHDSSRDGRTRFFRTRTAPACDRRVRARA
jgi:hypothetical protein